MTSLPITVLITCTERRNTLNFSLPYYIKNNMNVHVLDTSKEIWNKKDEYSQIKFFHYPLRNYNIYEMFNYHVKNEIDTEYIVWVADDDIITYEGLLAANQFYEKDIKKEFNNVSGLQIFSEHNIYSNSHYGGYNIIKKNIKTDNPKDRLFNIFHKGLYTPHGVVRKNVYERFTDIIIESLKNKENSLAPIRFYDKIWLFISALYGNNFPRLPVVYLIRTHRFERMINSKQYENIYPIVLEKDTPYIEIHNRLKKNNLLAKEFHSLYPNISFNDCCEIIKNTFNLKGIHSVPLNKEDSEYIIKIILNSPTVKIYEQLYL